MMGMAFLCDLFAALLMQAAAHATPPGPAPAQ
jgi:hypothetical protein